MKQPKGTQRVPNRGSFTKGDPRINRAGRPRSGLALAEAIRERIDPRDVVGLVEAYLADESVPAERKLGVLLPWVHAGYLKPPTTIAASITDRSAPMRDLSAVTVEERRELLARLRALPVVATDDEAA